MFHHFMLKNYILNRQELSLHFPYLRSKLVVKIRVFSQLTVKILTNSKLSVKHNNHGMLNKRSF